MTTDKNLLGDFQYFLLSGNLSEFVFSAITRRPDGKWLLSNVYGRYFRDRWGPGHMSNMVLDDLGDPRANFMLQADRP